ncbi:MAG: DUF3488 and DUF4129 domain-containing transglutaminase family protein [Planctomycetes bacterium]|nr:DUF3488 and DUF4129 domain-containing transglutaminase family protein [Planctomycetota bacterium]
MNPDPLFRRMAYVLVFMGIVVFCAADRNPALLLIAGSLLALSWYVVDGPAGRPLPNWAINLGTIASTGWLIAELAARPMQYLGPMGHFITCLLVVVFYGRKTNREYGIVMVLSLLQVVGACMLSDSILSGVLLALYGLLMLFTVLLFQLKATGDQVRGANLAVSPGGAPEVRPPFGRGCRGDLRLGGAAIGAMIAVAAACVFLFMPRGLFIRPGSPFNMPPLSARSGFVGSIRLDGLAPDSGDREVLMHVRFSVAGAPATLPPGGWLLRGTGLDQYDPGLRTWTRSRRANMADNIIPLGGAGGVLAAGVPPSPALEADVTMRSCTHQCLYAPFPAQWVWAEGQGAVIYGGIDRGVRLIEPWGGVLHYRVRAPLEAGPATRNDPVPRAVMQPGPNATSGPIFETLSQAYAQGWQVSAEPIRNYARRLLRDKGVSRDTADAPTPRDAVLAEALADHLRAHYRYTPAAAAPGRARSGEPISSFLFESREGHCELFASGLAAMARSLGMTARLVSGYRVYEYNRVGGYYVVRPEHAHAWVEVYCGEGGWVTVDPTPPDISGDAQRDGGWLAWLGDVYEHVEYAWFSSVIAYDDHARDGVIETAKTSAQLAATVWMQGTMGSVTRYVEERVSNIFADGFNLAATGLITVALVMGVAGLVRILFVRRRRLSALQLGRMPLPQRRGLTRRLGFYLMMLDILEQHGHIRPPWQSPFAFAQKLVTADPVTFAPVPSITEMFYEVRFGGRATDPQRARWVDTQLDNLRHALMRRRAGRH